MHFLGQVWGWLTTKSHWSGPEGILALLGHHVLLSLAAVLAATVIGVGGGLLLGHSGRGSVVAINAANALRAVPSFALLTLLAIQPTPGLKFGGFLTGFLALFPLAVPPILTNTYVGVRDVDHDTRSAAVGMGMTGRQVLWHVEAPLALPLMMAGVRTAAVEVVATATLAAYVSYSDLGTYIFTGLAQRDDVQTFAGALLVAALAGAVDLAFGAVQHLVTPLALRPRYRGRMTDASTRLALRRPLAISPNAD